VSKTKRYEIRAAPYGKRSGLAVFSDGEHHLSVAVLPKPWRNRKAKAGKLHALEAKWESDSRLSLTLYENDRAVVECTEQQTKFLQDIREKLDLNASQKDENATEKGSDQLIRIRSTTGEASDQQAEACKLDSIIELLQLVSLARSRGGTPSATTTGASVGSEVVSVDTNKKGAKELLLLSQWSLVQEVRRHLKEIRRGYVPRTETLGVVRGRITDRGLVQYAATGVPKLECNFDRFTESTPLARVLVTALEVVVSGALLHDMQVGSWSVAEALLDEAAQLRRYLGSIPSLPRSVAIETANRIRLTRLQQGWSRSLALAKQILNREPPKMESQQRGELDALVWWINTDKIWEQILEQGLRTIDPDLNAQSKGQEQKLVVWDKLQKQKSPDFVMAIEHQRWVIDAKYKLKQTIESGDQYQIFAYSHLARANKRPMDAAALIFPGSEERVRKHSRHPDQDLRLHLMFLPFPQPKNLAHWNQYIKDLSTAFSKRIGIDSLHRQADANKPKAGRMSQSAEQ
jgi:5-methylcytosine-specific restriction endonuclease McrBC regulatory subunit McrC